MSGKIKAKKPITQAAGPTFDHNDPAKFVNHGKREGKTMANGIVKEASGPIFHENTTHIKTMDADKPPMSSKSMGEKSWLDPHSTNKPRSTESEPVVTHAKRVLKSEYRK